MSSRSTAVSLGSSRARRIGILVLAAFVLALLASYLVPTVAPAGSAASAPVASASIFHPNLVVKNVGKKTLVICHNWNYPKGQWTATSCKGSTTGSLTTNQNSKTKYGWVDTDAVKVYKGYRLKEKRTSGSGRFAKTTYNNVTTCTHRADYYLKVQPGVASSSTRNFYYAKC